MGVFKLPEGPSEEEFPVKKGYFRSSTLNKDGTWTNEYIEIGDELQKTLDRIREEDRKLKEEGTPYWCQHEGRSVSHPAAYWKEDGYFRADGKKMQYKHGVMCSDCGGYIQEG